MAAILEAIAKKLFPAKDKDNRRVIEQADGLFKSQKYDDVCKLLDDEKYENDVQILWRLGRALYKKAKVEPEATKDVYLNEAYNVLSKALQLNEEDASLHKWMAIILHSKNRRASMTQKIKDLEEERNFLMRSLDLDPNDYSSLYMMGQWCFAMSSLSWLQRKLIGFLYQSPPKSTFEEAYQYFLRAEELQARYYIPNVYMLGRTCYCMNRYYSASYYLELAASLTPRTEYEEKCQQEAKLMNTQLALFRITSVFNDFAS